MSSTEYSGGYAGETYTSHIDIESFNRAMERMARLRSEYSMNMWVNDDESCIRKKEKKITDWRAEFTP